MSAKYFWLCGWNHIMPQESADSNGRRIIINRLCVGPVETDCYGIENNKFYHEYNIIEGILEGTIDFNYITKEEFLKELEYEIELSANHEAFELTKALSMERDKIK